MSRYTIETKNVNIIIGWDAPLGYYHLVIFDKAENIVWNNLDQQNAFPNNFAEYQTIIREITGIELPEDVIERLKHDKENNTGNFERLYKI